MENGTVWEFKTARFTVSLMLRREFGYQYDGDDEGGETQANLDTGEYVAFSNFVYVELDGTIIASDSLFCSVYAADEVEQFWTAHRDPDAMNRNCSLMRAARGANVCIGHHFPDMVRNAIREAREHLINVPKMRAA
jgi:hypothetical protein